MAAYALERQIRSQECGQYICNLETEGPQASLFNHQPPGNVQLIELQMYLNILICPHRLNMKKITLVPYVQLQPKSLYMTYLVFHNTHLICNYLFNTFVSLGSKLHEDIKHWFPPHCQDCSTIPGIW